MRHSGRRVWIGLAIANLLSLVIVLIALGLFAQFVDGLMAMPEAEGLKPLPVLPEVNSERAALIAGLMMSCASVLVIQAIMMIGWQMRRTNKGEAE